MEQPGAKGPAGGDGTVPAPRVITRRYLISLTADELDSLRDAVTVARIVSPERQRTSEQLADEGHRAAEFHSRVAAYWADQAHHAERAQRVIDRAQIEDEKK